MKNAILILLLGSSISVAQFTSTAAHLIGGPTLPAHCQVATRDVFFKTSATITPYFCSATDTWSAMSGGGGGVTGSGTANQVAYWSSSSAITGSSGLTYDGSTLTIGDTLLGADISTPANPVASHTKLYAKGGVWCSLSPAGAENCLGAGGGSPGTPDNSLQYRVNSTTFGGMAGSVWDNATRYAEFQDANGKGMFAWSADASGVVQPYIIATNEDAATPTIVASGNGTLGAGINLIGITGGDTTDVAGTGGQGGDSAYYSGGGGLGPAGAGPGGQLSFGAGGGGSPIIDDVNAGDAGNINLQSFPAGNAFGATGMGSGNGGKGSSIILGLGTGGDAGAAGAGGDAGNLEIYFAGGGAGMTSGANSVMNWHSANGQALTWHIPAFTAYDLTIPATQGTGALTNDGAGHLSWAPASLSGTSGSIGGGVLAAGACASGTVAVTGSTTSMTVTVSPNTYPGDGTDFSGYVSTNGTVTVKVCALVAVTPTSSTYNVRVIQ